MGNKHSSGVKRGQTKTERAVRTQQRAEATVSRMDDLEELKQDKIRDGVQTDEDVVDVSALLRTTELVGRGGSPFVKDDYVAILTTLFLHMPDASTPVSDIQSIRAMTSTEIINAIRLVVYTPQNLMFIREQDIKFAASNGIASANDSKNAAGENTAVVTTDDNGQKSTLDTATGSSIGASKQKKPRKPRGSANQQPASSSSVAVPASRTSNLVNDTRLANFK